MNVQKYEAFLKTAEFGSISKTAKEMGYTQSAISKMILELEREWDVKLLTRNHNGVELSAAGKELVSEVRKVLHDYENLNSTVALLHGINKGTIRLGTPVSIAAAILPGILEVFHNKYPNIKMELYEGEDEEISELLKRGVVDVCVLPEPYSQKYYGKPLVTDSLVAVLPKNHPMAEQEEVPIEIFETEEVIGLRERIDYDFRKFFDENKVTANLVYVVSNDFIMFSMVERGLGICVDYETMLRPLRFDVVVKSLTKTKKRDLVVCVKDRKSMTPLIGLFWDCVEEYIDVLNG